MIDALKRLLFVAVDRFQNLAGPGGLFEAAQRYRSKRDFANAEECYAKAAKLYAKKHGNRDPRTVLSLAGQAHCLLALDRVRKGERYTRRRSTRKSQMQIGTGQQQRTFESA